MDIEIRLHDHNNGPHTNSFTSRANDWEIFFLIDNLEYAQARRIEKHIKRMKSKIYITNLPKYPEIINKLIELYN